MLDTSYIIIESSEAVRAVIGFRVRGTLSRVYLKREKCSLPGQASPYYINYYYVRD